jgi:hypothetical protein
MGSRMDFEKKVAETVNRLLTDISNLAQFKAVKHYKPDDGCKIAKALRKQATITCNQLNAFKPIPKVVKFGFTDEQALTKEEV